MVRPGCVACCSVTLLLAVALMLVFAFAFPEPVHVTVEDATLHRFALAAPAAANGTSPSNNGTAAARSLVYNLALVVSVCNSNSAMRVPRTAPLYAELRFAGRPIGRVQVAGPADSRRFRPYGEAVHRFTAEGQSALGKDGAAELARESDAGEFQLELVFTRQFKYQAHSGRHSITLTCRIKLPISTAMVQAFFQSIECT